MDRKKLKVKRKCVYMYIKKIYKIRSLKQAKYTRKVEYEIKSMFV